MADLAPTRDNAGIIGCLVAVNGSPLAVGDPADDPTAPYVLSGLDVTWGRDDTVSQPPPASCSFSLVDEVGDRAWRRIVRTGRPITVDASSVVYPDPSVSQHFDPSFSTYTDGQAAPVAVRHGAAVIGTLAGRRAVRVTIPDDADYLNGTTVLVPPRPFIPPAGLPNAWDSLVKFTAGQTWRLGLAVFIPRGVTLTVRPVGFSSPYAGAPTVPVQWNGGVTLQQLDGADAWVTFTGLVTSPGNAAPMWLGLQVVIQPNSTQIWDTPPQTWDTYPDVTWDALSRVWLDDVQILAPGAPALDRRRVFLGRITDCVARYSQALGATVVDVVAQDYSADLANVYVGDDPWPAENAANRAARILALADPAGSQFSPIVSDPRPAATVLSRTDVDRQSALQLLQDAATSVDAVLRVASPLGTRSYLRLEDPAGRPPLRELRAGPGGIVTVYPVAAPPAGTVVLPADLVNLDVEWVQNVADVVSRVTLTWKEQTTPDLTDRTVTVTDPVTFAEVGDRTAAVSTALASALNAGIVAQQILSRLSTASWRMGGIVLDTSALDLTPDVALQVLQLLDGNSRPGKPVQITGIPVWTPAPATSAALYVEGGKLTHIDGCWGLSLNTSAATGLGQSAGWDDLNAAWLWDTMDPALTWDDLNGVGATP